jgi:flavodoxin
MKSLVTYATRHGNTRAIAEAIAAALAASGQVLIADVNDVDHIDPEIDLIVVGGPTEGHGMTGPVIDFFDRMAPGALAGIAAAAFDTRLRWPRVLSGSAAAAITNRLRHAGANLVREPESFLVTMKPELESGEVERAAAWATALADEVGAVITGSRQLAVANRRG